MTTTKDELTKLEYRMSLLKNICLSEDKVTEVRRLLLQHETTLNNFKASLAELDAPAVEPAKPRTIYEILKGAEFVFKITFDGGDGTFIFNLPVLSSPRSDELLAMLPVHLNSHATLRLDHHTERVELQDDGDALVALATVDDVRLMRDWVKVYRDLLPDARFVVDAADALAQCADWQTEVADYSAIADAVRRIS